MRYFDASALVKRYVRETGSTTVRRLLASNTPATSRLTEVEVASALVRLAQEGVFTTAERDRTFVAFDRRVTEAARLECLEIQPAGRR